MFFNSYEFIFIFLPLTLFVYYLFHKYHIVLNIKNCKLPFAQLWLVGMSLIFYSWFNVYFLPILMGSIVVNFLAGSFILTFFNKLRLKKLIFFIAILFNVFLLGYYKYYDFFVSNVNSLFQANWNLKHIMLPLGISFFTFQQLLYLISVFKGKSKKYNWLEYSLFVTFFPELTAGPIALHSEIIPQFTDEERHKPDWDKIACGVYSFAIGLFKKLVIADTLSQWVALGFDSNTALTFSQACFATLSYTLQIYFDFSGYCDMAFGLGKMFNIDIPINFNSPYKSENFKEFWNRWHMTLGRALSTFVYIPLGGNRKGLPRTLVNIMATFFVSGLWHGASWLFIIWGTLHGIATALHRIWGRFHIKTFRAINVTLTFLLLNIFWVFFRANTWSNAYRILKGIFTPRTLGFWRISDLVQDGIIALPDVFAVTYGLTFITILLYIVFFKKNTIELSKDFKPTYQKVFVTCLLLFVSILHMSRISPFIYYNF